MLKFLLTTTQEQNEQRPAAGLIQRARLASIAETDAEEDLNMIESPTNGFAVMRYLRILNERVYSLEEQVHNHLNKPL